MGIGDNGGLVIANTQIRARHQGRGQFFRTGDAEIQAGTRPYRAGDDQFFHGLDAALCLFGFGRLGFKTVHKGLQMRAFFVGFDMLGCRPLDFRCPLTIKIGVAAGVELQLLILQGQNVSAQVVQELSVVSHDDQGALIAQQRFFQPGNGVDIQVVGRFVQQQ